MGILERREGTRTGSDAAEDRARTTSLLPLALLGLVLVWIVASALSRGKGWAFFALGLATLAGLILAGRAGRRGLLLGGLYVLCMTAASAVAFEALLHVFPSLLGGYVANVAYTGYHWQGGGIYGLDEHAGPILRPSVARWMFWNGHWWWHETNADGYRGCAVERAEAIILGDSLVYGHGVNNDGTVSSQYEALTGRTAANLGQQGTSLIQSLLTLQRLGLRLAPRTVFVCAHPNDMEEALRDYGADELGRFLAMRVSASVKPVVVPRYRPLGPWDPRRVWSEHVALRMRCSGILGAAVRSLRDPSLRVASVATDGPFVPSQAAVAEKDPALAPDADFQTRLPWLAMRHAVLEMKRLCDASGARLVLLDLGYPKSFSAAVEGLAGEAGVTYSPAGRVALQEAFRGEEVYLPNDGHWTANGARIVALALAASAGADPERPGSPPLTGAAYQMGAPLRRSLARDGEH